MFQPNSIAVAATRTAVVITADRDRHPASLKQQDHRKQQTELRLDGENAEQHAGEHRPAIEAYQPADQKRRGVEAVLAEEYADRHARRDGEKHQPIARDRAGTGEQIERDADRAPRDIGRQIGHQAERPDEQQDVRRVRPEMFSEVGPEHFAQRRVVDPRIEPRRRTAAEDRAPAHPGVEEVATDDVMRAVDHRHCRSAAGPRKRDTRSRA